MKDFNLNFPPISYEIRHGLGVRIAGSHPAGPGSIPGVGKAFLTIFLSNRQLEDFFSSNFELNDKLAKFFLVQAHVGDGPNTIREEWQSWICQKIGLGIFLQAWLELYKGFWSILKSYLHF